MLNRVQVSADKTQYNILVADQLSDDQQVLKELTEHVNGRNVLIITDSNVRPLYAAKITSALEKAGAAESHIAGFPAGEQKKTLATVSELYDKALEFDLDRDSVIIALGGGVVGDVAGFVAATYMRGISFIQIPTTLLAMVDSSVGGKVGVDLPQGKNLIGAFYQPQLVAADVSFLETLPMRELRCGLAEIVKYGMIMDSEFFDFIKHSTSAILDYDPHTFIRLVRHCCELKARIVKEDEKERTGKRALLNYGHTFGHALEAMTSYDILNHGEGVAIGMGMAADLAVLIGKTEPETVQQQDSLLQELGLPIRYNSNSVNPENVYNYMLHDKKARKGKPRIILPNKIGSVDIEDDVQRDKIIEAIGGRCEPG